jgi:polyisoprenoid-binding protein YceI
VDVRVEVDLASLDTGIALRDKHMRENHLETAMYPAAVFRGGAVLEPSGRRLLGGESLRFRLAGTLLLHGVERDLVAQVDARLVDTPEGRALRGVTRFEVKLSDFDIARPRFLVLRLDEVQKILVEIRSAPLP